MKKRLLSTLLMVCMVAALFSGLSVTASADSNTIEHKLERGETVIGVCQKLGIDFYANYRWITETNKITNYGNLKPGRVIILPKPGTTPGSSSKPVTPPSGGGGAVAPPSGGALKLHGDDYIKGYYVHHVMQSGETVGGVCRQLGVDFASNSAEIQRVNNIKNYNRIYVGRLIKIPVPTPPTSGTFTAIVAHKVVRGDAMMNICNNYGLNYTSVLPELQAINNRKDNFSSIKVGQIILLPVVTSAVPGGSGSSVTPGGGSVTPGGGGSVTPGGGGNTSGGGGTTPSDGKTYKIATLTTNHGSYEVQVGGKKVSEAKSGTTVTIKANPDKFYQLGNITVTCGGKNVPISDGKFTMPTGNIRVSVSFVSSDEYPVVRDVTSNGDFSCLVNGNAVDKAAAGQRVTVKANAKYGYELDKISVIIDKDTSVPVSNDGVFTMPDSQVTVRVTFKRAEAHKITSNPTAGGYFETRINGKVVTEAHSGETVNVVAVPEKTSGYKFAGTTVKTASGREIKVDHGKFIMPEEDVTVSVKFDKNAYNVSVQQPANGSVSVSSTKASAGDTITVTAKPNDEYECTGIIVNGKEIEGTSFTMPVGDVTVSASFKVKTYTISNTSIQSKVSVDRSSAAAGETVTIKVTPGENEKVHGISITGGKYTTVAENSQYTFVMPSQNVEVYISFEEIPATDTASVDEITIG